MPTFEQLSDEETRKDVVKSVTMTTLIQIQAAESLLDQLQLFAKWILISRFLEESAAVEQMQRRIVDVLAYFAPLHWTEIVDVFAGM